MPTVFSETPPQPYYVRVNGVLVTTEPIVVEVMVGNLVVRLYPNFQSDHFRVKGDVARVIELFRGAGLSDRAILDWYYTPNPWLKGNDSPVNARHYAPNDVFTSAERHANGVQMTGP